MKVIHVLLREKCNKPPEEKLSQILGSLELYIPGLSLSLGGPRQVVAPKV